MLHRHRLREGRLARTELQLRRTGIAFTDFSLFCKFLTALTTSVEKKVGPPELKEYL